jgi:hypothetical protein
MRAITKVKMITVPSTEELNAILFDMQEDMINILKVDLHDVYPNGDLVFIVTYHIQYLDAIEEEENGEQEYRSNEKI